MGCSIQSASPERQGNTNDKFEHQGNTNDTIERKGNTNDTLFPAATSIPHAVNVMILPQRHLRASRQHQRHETPLQSTHTIWFMPGPYNSGDSLVVPLQQQFRCQRRAMNFNQKLGKHTHNSGDSPVVILQQKFHCQHHAMNFNQKLERYIHTTGGIRYCSPPSSNSIVGIIP